MYYKNLAGKVGSSPPHLESLIYNDLRKNLGSGLSVPARFAVYLFHVWPKNSTRYTING